jgi:hypothetical protein
MAVKRALRHQAVGVVVVVVALVASACDEGQTTDQTDGTVTPAQVPVATTRPAEQRLELDAAERSLLATAHQTVVAECMETSGFDYVVSPLGEQAGSTADEFQRPVEWNLITGRTPEDAAVHGYNIPEAQGEGDSTEQSFEDPLAGLSEDEIQKYSEAMFGDGRAIEVSVDGRQVFFPDGGCIGEANHAVYDDVERWVTATESVSNLALRWGPAARSDAEFQEGVGAWRECMLDLGYDYSEPFDAMNDASAVEDLEREIAIAVADTSCTEQTDLRSITLRVIDRHRSVLEAEHAADYAAIAEIERAALDRAQRILAGQS